ncbi:MAG: mandelate racemase/muconate lactonizing protein [uncultured bacterium]|nr:MAG: mandelate racemase/muconate lactonizing protein [uncultured bacterium]
MQDNKIHITDLTVEDVRFPAFDRAVAYITLHTNYSVLQGHGLTMAMDHHHEASVAAIYALKEQVIGKKLSSITEHMGEFWRQLTRDHEQAAHYDKNIIHMTTAVMVNAIWDMWARSLQKPLWRLIVDMSPEELVHCLDLTYMADALTETEALNILRNNAVDRGARIKDLLHGGYPASPNPQTKYCRTGSINEILTLLLIAAKFKVAVYPYTGNFGEYTQHLAMVDYIYISGSLKNRMLEYVDHLEAHFKAPAIIKNGCYQVPLAPGYNIEMKTHSVTNYRYPNGDAWREQSRQGE